MRIFRYTDWDGTQEIFSLKPDDAMDALADALLRHGNLDWAFRDLLQRGFTSEDGTRSMRGLQDLLKEVEAKKRDILDKYSPESFKLSQEQLQELMQKAQEYFHKLQDFMERLQERYREQSERMSGKMEDLYEKYQQLREKLRDRMQSRPPSGSARRQLSESEIYQNLSQMLDRLNKLLEDENFLENLLKNLDMSSQSLNNLLNNLDLLSDQQLSELMGYLDQIQRLEDLLSQFQFRGSQMMGFEEGQRILSEMQQIEDLLKLARWGYGNLDDLDLDKVKELLGPEAFNQLFQLKELERMLEEAGYVRRSGNKLELTPKGTRKIGYKALHDIFRIMKRDWYGKHPSGLRGISGERTDDTKPYEYGDHFYVDLGQTLKNSLIRGSTEIPVKIHPTDFEVYRSEHLTESSTVIMLDMSHSMELYGFNRFSAAKKVALALESLIRSQFPTDHLYIVGFGDYARELKLQDLPYVTVGPEHTNTQEGLALSRKLLSKHQSVNKQIILITDGRPTAARINGHLFIHTWGLHPMILEETYREAERCRKSGIIINTFMLAEDYYLVDFVRQLTSICKGRAFYTTPSSLGEYIIVDYIAKRRRRIA
ncbi:MAG: VWA domain-containing protein [Candidatus Tectomicrobia bacterium]|nr:VWA domain-containing protein [Candidatus Tectomicrobia bacterium]